MPCTYGFVGAGSLDQSCIGSPSESALSRYIIPMPGGRRFAGVGRARGVGRTLGVRSALGAPAGVPVAAGVAMGGRLLVLVRRPVSTGEDCAIAVEAVSDDRSSRAIAVVTIFKGELLSDIRVVFMFWIDKAELSDAMLAPFCEKLCIHWWQDSGGRAKHRSNRSQQLVWHLFTANASVFLGHLY
jgi:hypothetical protein